MSFNIADFFFRQMTKLKGKYACQSSKMCVIYLLTVTMTQDLVSAASVYREFGIFAPLTKFMSCLLCLTASFRMWSQVLGFVCDLKAFKLKLRISVDQEIACLGLQVDLNEALKPGLYPSSSLAVTHFA